MGLVHYKNLRARASTADAHLNLCSFVEHVRRRKRSAHILQELLAAMGLY